jgi:hypothetical protein
MDTLQAIEARRRYAAQTQATARRELDALKADGRVTRDDLRKLIRATYESPMFLPEHLPEMDRGERRARDLQRHDRGEVEVLREAIDTFVQTGGRLEAVDADATFGWPPSRFDMNTMASYDFSSGQPVPFVVLGVGGFGVSAEFTAELDGELYLVNITPEGRAAQRFVDAGDTRGAEGGSQP